MAGSATHQRLEEESRKKAVIPFKNSWALAASAVVAAILCLGLAQRADDPAQLQQRFDLEKDGVRKAKLLQKLGDAQFKKEREAAQANDYSAVGLEMEKYRDNARAALEALKKTRPDAERHSGGYKQLEMHVGRGIREIRDVILSVPEQYRPPMEIVEQDLKDLDVELLRLLFPRRPGEKPLTPKGASTPKKPAGPEKQP
jgi:hypothetical protein